MHFDVVRAWKDETYRQSLSEEQLSTLPANPSGELELSDNELEDVFGGNLGDGFIPALGAATASSATSAKKVVVHSFAVICEINIYSIDIKVLNINLISIGNTHSTICIHKE